MTIYCNSEGVIYDVGENTTGDNTLIRYEVDDKDNPFATWKKGKILCYKVRVQDNHIVMMTPAVDSRLIRNFENTQAYKFTKTAYIDDTECIFENIPAGNVTVYCSVPHTVEKQDGRVVVKFEALTEVIEITISIL